MSFHLSAAVAERRLDLTFNVAPGETLALLGPNGAGKSTALAIAAGHLKPDRGDVILEGRTLTEVPPHQREIAVLAQEALLFPHLDVRENVAFGPRSRGRSRSLARETADRWLHEVGADELADRRATELSGGEAQRVALARALATDPRLLLLDEPMAALDVGIRPALRQTLRRVLAERTTVLVTHDVLDALLLADRVVVLDDGQVVEEGTTQEVLTRPRSTFAAQLAGLNLLRGTWAGDHVRLEDGTAVYGMAVDPAPALGDAVVATFRPNAVAVYRQASSSGSPRNAFPVRIGELEPSGELIRVRSTGSRPVLSADVTPYAVADLDLVPDLEVTFTVKATEVAVYRL